MREKIESAMEVVDIAKQTLEKLGIVAIIQPIPGGTGRSDLYGIANTEYIHRRGNLPWVTTWCRR